MKRMTVKTQFRTYEGCWLQTDHYLADSSLVIDIVNPDDHIARITTCLDRLTVHEDEAYVDTNNCPWAEDFIHRYRLGEDTQICAQSGFCTYPLYKFNMDRIKEFCLE